MLATHPGRPALHRHAVSGAGREQRRLGRPRQPVDVGRLGPRQPLRRRRRQRDQHRLRRGRVLLDHLRLARHRHALRLHQGSPGQDRRLRGGVRPVDGRRGQRRHQERHQPAARIAVRLLPDRRAGGGLQDVPVGQRHGEHRGHRPVPTSAWKAAGRSSATRCSSSARSTRRGRRATFMAPDGFPLESLGEVDREREYAVLLRQGHLAGGLGAPLRCVVLRRSVEGRHGAAAHLVADWSPTTSSFSELDYGGHNQTVRYDGVLSPNLLLEASFATRFNKIAETPSVDTWRVTDTTWCPTSSPAASAATRQGNEQQELPVHGQGHLRGRRPPGQERRPVRGRRATPRSTSAPARRSPPRRPADRDRRVGSASSPTRPSAGSTG